MLECRWQYPAIASNKGVATSNKGITTSSVLVTIAATPPPFNPRSSFTVQSKDRRCRPSPFAGLTTKDAPQCGSRALGPNTVNMSSMTSRKPSSRKGLQHEAQVFIHSLSMVSMVSFLRTGFAASELSLKLQPCRAQLMQSTFVSARVRCKMLQVVGPLLVICSPKYHLL